MLPSVCDCRACILRALRDTRKVPDYRTSPAPTGIRCFATNRVVVGRFAGDSCGARIPTSAYDGSILSARNAWREGRARLDAAEEFLDAGTIALLERRGIDEGWTCLKWGLAADQSRTGWRAASAPPVASGARWFELCGSCVSGW